MMAFILIEDIRKIWLLTRKLARERHLDRAEWNYFMNAHFSIYGVGTLLSMMLIVRVDSFREVEIALIVFSPLFFSLFLLESFRKFLIQKNRILTLGAVVLMLFGCFMFALGGVGYVYFVNAVTSPRDVHVAAGRVEKLEPRRPRNAPSVSLFDGRTIVRNVPINDHEYETLHLGDYYVSNLRLGGLGLYYRWRIDSWNRGWEATVRQTTGEIPGRTK